MATITQHDRRTELLENIRTSLRLVINGLTHSYLSQGELITILVHSVLHDLLPLPEHYQYLDLKGIRTQLNREVQQSSTYFRLPSASAGNEQEPLLLEHELLLSEPGLPLCLSLQQLEYHPSIHDLHQAPHEYRSSVHDLDQGPHEDGGEINHDLIPEQVEEVDEHASEEEEVQSGVGAASRHTWKVKYSMEDGILRLAPTVEQWTDFPGLIKYARELGAERTGIFTVKLPEVLSDQHSTALGMLRKPRAWQFKSINHVDKVFRLHRTIAKINFMDDAGQHDVHTCNDPVTFMLDKFEEDLARDSCFDNVQYCTDLQADEPEERLALGLPSSSPIADLQGDRLSETVGRVPGLHTIFAYRSSHKFGSPFALHVEDWNLFSVNYLRKGRKTVVTIAPKDYKKLVRKCRESNSEWFKASCSQILRHASVYIPTRVLREWDISYTILDQKEGEVFISFPNAAHQGFSHGFTDAEAKNYADATWEITDYQECDTKCSKNVIPREMMVLRDTLTTRHDPSLPSISAAAEQNSQFKASNFDSLSRAKQPDGDGKRKTKSRHLPIISKKQKVSTKFTKLSESIASVTPLHSVRIEELYTELIDAFPTREGGGLRLLSELILAIGSPKTVVQAQKLFSLVLARKQGCHREDLSFSKLSTMQRLDNLEVSVTENYLLRRHYLVQLREERQTLRQKRQTEKSMPRLRSTSSANDGRTDTWVHNEIVKLQYPDVGADESSDDFRKCVQSLKRRLMKAKHWCTLQEQFSPAVILWIPSGGDWTAANTELERTPQGVFDRWLSMLIAEREEYLSKLSKRSQRLYNFLTEKSENCTPQLCAELESDIQKIKRASDALFAPCS